MEYTYTHTITTDEIREAWDAIQKGENPVPSQSSLRSSMNGQWRGDTFIKWMGASGQEINSRLQDGYFPEGDTAGISPGDSAEIDMPFVEFNEEQGDLSIEAVINGEDAYYMQWENDEAKRGLKIRACFDTNAGTPAEALSDYLTWILKVIQSAQAKGVAPDVELFVSSGDSWQGESSKDLFTIPVVKAGEIADVTAWRAFLAPGSFRSLGFLAMGIAGEKCGKELAGGLGHALGHGFNVTKDSDGGTDTLTIDCPASFRKFDEADMNAKLEKVNNA